MSKLISLYIVSCDLIDSGQSHALTAAMFRGSTEKYLQGAPSPVLHGQRLRSKGLQPRESPMDNLTADEPDTGICNPPPPQIPKRKPKHEDKDTNILMIKFGALSKPCKVHTGDPVICSNDQCAAILNHHSKITKEAGVEGNVRFCVHAVFRKKLADIAYTKLY